MMKSIFSTMKTMRVVWKIPLLSSTLRVFGLMKKKTKNQKKINLKPPEFIQPRQ